MAAPTTPAEQSSPLPYCVSIQAGDHRFIVEARNLASASVYFANVLTPDHSLTLPRTSNGAYIVDADPNIFSHLIRYIQTRRFPLFYTIREGFNRPLYDQIFDLADRFMVIRLALWIGRRGYENVVKVEKKIQVVSAAELRWNPPLAARSQQTEVKYLGDGGEDDAEDALVISKRTLVNWEALGPRHNSL